MRVFDGGSTCDEVVEGVDLSGKAAVVTGANAGIGRETARALAKAGARVYLACRNPIKGMAAVDYVRRAHPGAKAEFLPLDLGSLESVRAFADTFPERALEILVCNAGVFGPYAETAEGFERTVGVCHLGHFALVQGLLERLKAGRPSRVVVVASGSHRSPARLDFDALPLTREDYSELVAYGQAKLCNVLFALELQQRYQSDGITAVSLHPGALIATEIGRNSLLAKVAMLLARPFSKSLAQGAATSVYCATAPEVESLGGGYFQDCAERPASPEGRDPVVALKLWDVTERWLKDLNRST